MKKFSLLFISVLFLASPITIQAASLPLVGNRLPLVQEQLEEKNNDKKNEDSKGKADITPVPTAVISKAPMQPTQTPSNETKKPNPSPTIAKPAPTTAPSRNTSNPSNSNGIGGIVVPQNIDRNRVDNRDNESTAVTNTRRTVSPTPTTTTSSTGVAGTTQRTSTKEPAAAPKQKEQPAETPLKKIQDIIAPPLASVVQVKGANYYQDEKLSPVVTANLLYFALGLFLTGMLILKLPLLKSGIDKIRRRIGRENNEGFTVPYIETK